MNQFAISRSEHSSGYFAHHGWMAPGIKLFRRLSFPAKSAWILVSMMIPILSLLVLLYRSDADLMNASKLERQGVAGVNTVTALMKELAGFRQAATLKSSDVSARQASVSAAMDQVAKVQREFDATVTTATDQHYEKLTIGVKKLLQKPIADTPDATFATHTEVVDSALDLLADIGNGARLVLDPELDTYHMMNLAVMVGPQYGEYLERLRVLTALARSENSGKPTSEQLRKLERYQVLPIPTPGLAVSLAITVRSLISCRTSSSMRRIGLPTPMNPPIINDAPLGIFAIA